MPDMTTQELLARMEEGRAEWDRLLVEVGLERMSVPLDPDDPDGWTAKDAIAHIMAYERWTAAQIRAGLRGDEPSSEELYGQELAPEGVDTADVDVRNRAFLAHYRETPLHDLMRSAEEVFNELLAAVQEVPDDRLADPNAFPWTGGMSLLDLIPQQSYAHYRQHEPLLRAFILASEGLTDDPDEPVEV